MRIERIAPEEMARRWGATKIAPPPSVSFENIRPALFMVDPLRIPFRARMWTAHVDWQDGARLVDIHQRAEKGVGGVELFRELSAIAGRVLRRYPESRWQRFLRVSGLRRNPVRGATERELGELLGFFLMCRTNSSVGSWAGAAATSASTSSTSWPTSSGVSPPGRVRTATRSPGRTSSTASPTSAGSTPARN